MIHVKEERKTDDRTEKRRQESCTMPAEVKTSEEEHMSSGAFDGV